MEEFILFPKNNNILKNVPSLSNLFPTIHCWNFKLIISHLFLLLPSITPHITIMYDRK